jgi:hypothetical protein
VARSVAPSQHLAAVPWVALQAHSGRPATARPSCPEAQLAGLPLVPLLAAQRRAAAPSLAPALPGSPPAAVEAAGRPARATYRAALADWSAARQAAPKPEPAQAQAAALQAPCSSAAPHR